MFFFFLMNSLRNIREYSVETFINKIIKEMFLEMKNESCEYVMRGKRRMYFRFNKYYNIIVQKKKWYVSFDVDKLLFILEM